MGLDLKFDTSRSLVELSDARPEPDEFSDDLAGILYKLSTKPLRRLEPGEMLLLIRENVGLVHLVPYALTRLEDDPFLQGAENPGDLLTALLQADYDYWRANKPLWEFTIVLVTEAVNAMSQRMAEEQMGDYLPHFIGDDFMAAALHFRDMHREQE